MKAAPPAFPRLVADAMERRGLGLRELCRRAGLDPSLFSKVLAGKRRPPSDEEPLRRLAEALELDPVALIVAAGRLPSDWDALSSDADLLRAVHALATAAPSGFSRRSAARRPAPPTRPAPREPARAAPPAAPFSRPSGGLSDELL